MAKFLDGDSFGGGKFYEHKAVYSFPLLLSAGEDINVQPGKRSFS